MENEEPPLITILVWIAVLGLLVLSAIFWSLDSPENREYESRNYLDTSVAQWQSPVLTFRTYGSLRDRIVMCESGGNPTAQNPKSTAYGLCQFISPTWEYVQEKWGVTLDRHNPVDQIYACDRLLEEEGTKHWLESKKCWR